MKNFKEVKNQVEKFGIFNILSALSSFSAKTDENSNDKNDIGETNSNSEKTPRDVSSVGIFTGEERKNKMLDILIKHDEISKRIDKKKPLR